MGDWELICQGIPRHLCEEFAESSFELLHEAGRALQAIIVRCTGRCTPIEGDGETIAVFADGTTQALSGWSYRTGD